MTACEKIGECGYTINEFVYEKACTGIFRSSYCPKFREPHLKLPKEWRSIQTSVTKVNEE